MSNLLEQVAIVKRELRKLENMMYANMLQLPWDEAPTWARWAAMDRDFGWWWYEDEPVMRISTWFTQSVGLKCESFAGPPCTNWKESKRKRP